MKNLFRLFLVLLTVGLVSCQSDEDSSFNVPLEDDTEIIGDGFTLRASYYFDLALGTDGKSINYYLHHNDDFDYNQFNADYDVQWFVGEDFDWLSNAFNYIESYPRTNGSGSLYYPMEQNENYFLLYSRGYQADYSTTTAASSLWRLSMDKVPEMASNVGCMFKIPVRTKIIPKNGGYTRIYDIIWTCRIRGGTSPSFTWQYKIIRSY
jgi:hypothetical protein